MNCQLYCHGGGRVEERVNYDISEQRSVLCCLEFDNLCVKMSEENVDHCSFVSIHYIICECGETFPSEEALKTHLEQEHPHKRERKEYKCGIVSEPCYDWISSSRRDCLGPGSIIGSCCKSSTYLLYLTNNYQKQWNSI